MTFEIQVQEHLQAHTTTLSNGLRIVHVAMPALQSATVAFFVGVGSRYEPTGMAGLSHLIEHMLFKGTPKYRSATHISRTIESIGGVLNAATDKESTSLWAKVGREHVGTAIGLLGDMLRNSRMRYADIVREQNVICEELNMLRDDPEDWAHVLADELLWSDQPVGREVAGTRASVEALQRRNIVDWLTLYYGVNNVVMCVAGGIERDRVLQLAELYLRDWKSCPAPRPSPILPRNGTLRCLAVDRHIEQIHAALVFLGVHRDHPDRHALDVLGTILGGGTSSRLFVRIRERLGLAYDVQAYPGYLSDTGSFTVYAAAEPRRFDVMIEAVLEQVHRIRRHRVSYVELRSAQLSLRGRLALSLEDSYSVAHWYGSQQLLDDRMETPDMASASIDQVTEADVLRVARAYLAPERSHLAAVGPNARRLVNQTASSHFPT